MYHDKLPDMSAAYAEIQEKMAKKDHDGDGKIETGKEEYFGARDKAIKKAMKKEHHEKDADGKVIEHDVEEVEEAMVVTNADKKGNTPAYQNFKKGMKGKDGKPLYKAADHMKENQEIHPDDNVLSQEELERVAEISREYDAAMEEGSVYGLTKGTGKPGGAMKAYLDNKAKKLEAEKKKQKPEYRNNPAFGDPSHHSNAKK